jgi:hypothetical protein
VGALIYPERRESIGPFSELQMALSEAVHSNARRDWRLVSND